MEHERAQSALEQLFVDACCPEPLSLRAHLAECASCRARFNEMALLARAAAGDAERAGRFEQAWSEALFAATLAGGAGARTPSARPRRPRWRRAEVVSALALGVAAAALAVVVTRTPVMPIATPAASSVPGVEPDPFGHATARGGSASVHEFEIYCAEPTQDELRYRASDPFRHELRCALQQELQFQLINAGPPGHEPPQYVTLLGLGERGWMQWYLPSNQARRGSPSMPLGAMTTPTPWGQSIRLQMNHRPGKVHIFGLFSSVPLTPDDVRSVLEEGRHASEELLKPLTNASEGAKPARRPPPVIVRERVLIVEADTTAP
jgi:hypothetical protein